MAESRFFKIIKCFFLKDLFSGAVEGTFEVWSPNLGSMAFRNRTKSRDLPRRDRELSVTPVTVRTVNSCPVTVQCSCGNLSTRSGEYVRAASIGAISDIRTGAIGCSKQTLPNRMAVIGCSEQTLPNRTASIGCREQTLPNRTAAFGCREQTSPNRTAAIGCREQTLPDRTAAIGWREQTLKNNMAAIGCREQTLPKITAAIGCREQPEVVRTAPIGCREQPEVVRTAPIGCREQPEVVRTAPMGCREQPEVVGQVLQLDYSTHLAHDSNDGRVDRIKYGARRAVAAAAAKTLNLINMPVQMLKVGSSIDTTCKKNSNCNVKLK